MYLEHIDIDNICEELPEISSPKIFESGKFAKVGLFSQQIFGPIKSYYCACPKAIYRGRNSKETKCSVCNVDIVSSYERRKRFAKIKLPFPVLNPIFYYLVSAIKPAFKRAINDMCNYKNAYYFNEDGKLIKIAANGQLDESEEEANIEKMEGLSGCITLIQSLIDGDDSKPEIQFLRDNFHKITINNVIVIPPDFRPCGKNQNGTNVSDEINQFYSTIIVRSNHMKSLPYEAPETDAVYRANFKHIQIALISLYDYVLGKLSKKKGLIRSNILGKRVDFSGRAVISPDPTISLDTCKVPYLMMLEIQKPQLVAYLVSRRICKRYNKASMMIDDCIKTQDPSLFQVVEDFCVGKYCIINRQPTLHRLGVLAFKIQPHLGKTIQIPPMSTSPYNADFDGDAVAIYIPISDKSNSVLVL